MTLYAASIATETIILNRTVFNSTVYLVNAANEYEATGKAIEFARQRWPENDGYFSHQAICIEVPMQEKPTHHSAARTEWPTVVALVMLEAIIVAIALGAVFLFVSQQPGKGAVAMMTALLMEFVKYGAFWRTQ